jgi:tRNA A-37 threonylcarbamoyl transferase component Bud32
MNTYIKPNVSLGEYILHDNIYNLGIVKIPKIHAYDVNNKIMIMEQIEGINVSDNYGENDDDTPPEIYDNIRGIIKKLVDINIDYIDITGYNFIIDKNDDIWIIDFEHAYIRKTDDNPNKFISKLLDGHNGWNPYFR